MKENMFCFRKIVIENTRDVDTTVKDAFGTDHILWPGQKKRLIVLKKRKRIDI